ncbi:MAG: hypothetical protein IKH75_21745 [Ruminococcus sp.]|nr:hypothetical protein [Ruminococcus sp.]
MPDNKLSLEDILEEYSPDASDTYPHVGRVDAQKIINSTLPEPALQPPPPPQRRPVSHEKNELFDKPKDEAVIAEQKPADPSRNTIAVASSEGISDVKDIMAQKAPEPDETGAAPMIRRMSDSTRAKEAAKQQKKHKKSRRQKDAGFTYKKETPSGEYMYDPPNISRRKRSRGEILTDANGPDSWRNVTDIVPSPAAVEAAKPAENTPRADVTSIDLSAKPEVPDQALDVHIQHDTEEQTGAKTKKRRTKRLVDFNYYGDVEDVGRDIYELKNVLTSRVGTLALTAFLSLYITVCDQFGLPILDILSREHIFSYLLVHLILGAIALVVSLPVITKGVKNLFTMSADSDSMSAITAIACTLALLFAFFRMDMAKAETIHVYMPVGILSLLFNAIGKLLILRRADRNFRFISQEFDRHAVVYVRDEERAERLTRGTIGDFPILAAMRKTDFLTDFLRYTYSSDITDSYCRKAAPICLVVSMIVSIVLTIVRMGTLASVDSAVFGLSIFSMLICAAACIGMPFVANVPLEKVSHQTLRNKGILLGYQSVDDLYDANSILVSADTFFPEGTVKMGGIKVFSNTKLDEALLEAASLSTHAGSIMRRLFSDVVVPGKDDILYPIENFSIEEDQGLCGWINNRRVLLGSRELMTSHNIEGVPTKAKEAEYATEGQIPLYLSISGNLAAMFMVELNADRYVKRWAKRLAKSKVYMITKSVDPCLTSGYISSLFGIPDEMIKVIPKRLYEDFDSETKKTVRMSASMACTGRFSSMAQLILGTKVIHISAIIGLIVQTVSILTGLGLGMMMILSKAFEINYVYMSASALVIYNLLVTAVTCIAVSIKKLK